MALVLNDRVRETTTTTGTGAVSLGGAVSGYETFAAGIGNSNTCYYAIIHRTANEWEVGYGTLDGDSSDLTRTTPISSSNSDSAVDFASGTKDVFVTLPASKAVYEDNGSDVTLPDDLILDSDSAVLKFGDDQDTTLTHTDGTGLTLNSTNKLTFGDVATYINQSSDGVMTIAGEATIDLNASTAVLVSNDLKLDSDSAVLSFGGDSDVSLTHVADTALLLNSSRQLQFGDSGTYIYQSADGVLDLVSDTEIEINATTIDINGAVEISGDLTVSGDDITMGTNTSGAALIADGTNFNPVVISGDIAIATDGTASIGSGVIVNADVNASAAIADSKLATISTADKVSAAAIQVDGATDGTGITIVDGDKLIVDDAGATKYVEASQLKTYAAGSSASAGFALAMAVAL
jgi:phage baseplate assembly protein gpV